LVPAAYIIIQAHDVEAILGPEIMYPTVTNLQKIEIFMKVIFCGL
jgi:hypothetical protein